MPPSAVKFDINAGAFEDFIASTLALVEALDGPAETVTAFVERILDLLDEGGAIDLDQPAAGAAGKLVIGLKPSQRLLDLVAAFWAGNGKGGAIEHDVSPTTTGAR